MFSSNTSSSGVTPDPQFNYVTMLLHGNGTNGAQNNTFLDSSTNNFTITRNGNTTQGTFSPYGSNWSNYFDGSGDSLTAPSNAAFGFGTGDFTIEAFCFIENTGGFIFAVPDGSGDSLLAYLNSSNQIQVYYPGAGNFISTSGQRSIWAHVAVSRNSGTLRVFVNGTLVNSTSNSKNWPTTNFEIGTSSVYGGSATGYISNVRVLKGTGLYTSAFTPPTTPLTAITNTSLLTCQSNRFIDNSTNNFTITRSGNVSVQRFSPFSPTAAYSAATIGGSGYFDGNGDNLAVISAGSSLSLTGDFTIEFWVYRVAQATNEFYLSSGLENNTFRFNASFGWYFTDSGNAYIFTSNVNAVPLGAYNHLAFVRSGSSITMYVNGASVGSVTYASTINYSSALYIAGSSVGVTPGWCNAYISNFRIVKGTAVYTSNFTPPTAPVTAITNTNLLLNFTNGGIIDNAMMNDLETVFNAQISTSVSKFGGGSIYFDGSSATFLRMADNPNFSFGSGDWTIEGWVYTTTSGDQCIAFIGGNTSFYGVAFRISGAGSRRLQISISTSGSGWALDYTATTGGIPLNTFTHVAVVRSGSNILLFENGTQVGTTQSLSGAVFDGTLNQIGTMNGANMFTGYLDDFRITKGYARYTANFTPPAAPFPDQ